MPKTGIKWTQNMFWNAKVKKSEARGRVVSKNWGKWQRAEGCLKLQEYYCID